MEPVCLLPSLPRYVEGWCGWASTLPLISNTILIFVNNKSDIIKKVVVKTILEEK
jgi:hypothetical protein